jgi:gliding motility-associated-like protein
MNSLSRFLDKFVILTSILTIGWNTNPLYSDCLVSHYKFSGNVNDSKGNNHGTNHGASLTTDRFGNPNSAYEFNRSENDYISIPYQPFFLPNYTYSVWVKVKSYPSTGNAFIFLSIGGTGGDQNMQIENNQNNASLGYLTGFTLTAYNINGNLRFGVWDKKLPNLNEWYHLVCTRDSNYFKMYINGCLVHTSPSTKGSLPFYGNSNPNATIGARNNISKFFDGVLDEVRIYNCALNEVEVSKLYNEFNPLQVTKDTNFNACNFKPFKLKASRSYCSYKWIDIKKRNVILGTDSQLYININKTTTFRVFVNTGDSATVTITIDHSSNILPRDSTYCDSFSRLIVLKPGYKYYWDNNDSTIQRTINQPGKYWVKYTDSSACIHIDTLVFKIDKIPELNLKDTVKCVNEFIILDSKLSGLKYLWSNGDTTQTTIIKSAGDYFLTVENKSKCKIKDTIRVTDLFIPPLNIGRDTFFCGPFVWNVSANGLGTSYSWNTSESTNKISVSTEGKYFVKVTYANNCFNYDTIDIKKFKLPILNLGSDTAFCLGQMINLKVGKFKSIRWDNLTNDTLREINKSGKYFVTVIDSNNCLVSDTINVTINPKAIALFTLDKKENPIKSPLFNINNKATNYDILHYNFGNGDTSHSLNPSVKYNISGNYTITQYALNQFNCNDTFSLNVLVYDDFVFLIPNAFSPNSDGKNEIFKPYFEGVDSENYEMKIFNRWGELLFVSNNTQLGWDGKYKGEYVMEGVYLYMVKVRTSKRTFRYFNGTMTLLR